MMKHLNILDWATLILAVCMVGCLGKWPYDYYMLVRFASMVIFVFQTIRFFNAEKENLAIVFAALTLLFQPIFKISLSKVTWNIIDVVVAVLLCIFVFSYKGEQE